MTVKIGINGLGRIGRMIIRSLIENNNKKIEIKHINSRSNSAVVSSLLKYDSIHGKFNCEIKYGDNDRLASRVAQITNADTLILLSDVDGLYTKNPKIFKDAKLIKKIDDLKKDLKKIYIKGVNEYGSGGMHTKIEAAKICQLAGTSMVIANGLYSNPISKIIEKNNCTWFSPKISKLDARKIWIISSVAPKGALIIDDGAKKALKSGKSLLAAGIRKVSGRFNKGDHIKVLDKKNNECARGLSSFTSDEVTKIMGHHSNEIEKLLGYVAKSEVIHKDDMVEI